MATPENTKLVRRLAQISAIPLGPVFGLPGEIDDAMSVICANERSLADSIAALERNALCVEPDLAVARNSKLPRPSPSCTCSMKSFISVCATARRLSPSSRGRSFPASGLASTAPPRHPVLSGHLASRAHFPARDYQRPEHFLVPVPARRALLHAQGHREGQLPALDRPHPLWRKGRCPRGGVHRQALEAHPRQPAPIAADSGSLFAG